MVGFDLKIAGLADDGEQSAGEGILAEGFDVVKPFAVGQRDAEAVRTSLIHGAYTIGLITGELRDQIMKSREDAFATIYSARLEAGVNQAEAAAGAFARAYPEIADQNYESLVSDPSDAEEKALRGRVSSVIKTLAGGDKGAAGALLRDMAAIRAGWVAGAKTTEAAGDGQDVTNFNNQITQSRESLDAIGRAGSVLAAQEAKILTSLKDVYWKSSAFEITNQANTLMADLFALRRFLDDQGYERDSSEIRDVMGAINEFFKLLKDENLTYDQLQSFLKSPLFERVESIIDKSRVAPTSRVVRLFRRGSGRFDDKAAAMQEAIKVLKKFDKPKVTQGITLVRSAEYADGVENDCRDMYEAMRLTADNILNDNALSVVLTGGLRSEVVSFLDLLESTFKQRLRDNDKNDPLYEELVIFQMNNYQPLKGKLTAFLAEVKVSTQSLLESSTVEKARLEQRSDALKDYSGSPLVAKLDEIKRGSVDAAEKKRDEAVAAVKTATDDRSVFSISSAELQAKIAAEKALKDVQTAMDTFQNETDEAVKLVHLTQLTARAGVNNVDHTAISDLREARLNAEGELANFTGTGDASVKTAQTEVDAAKGLIAGFNQSVDSPSKLQAVQAMKDRLSLQNEATKVEGLGATLRTATRDLAAFTKDGETKIAALEAAVPTLGKLFDSLTNHRQRKNKNHSELAGLQSVAAGSLATAETAYKQTVDAIGVPEIQRLSDELLDKEFNPEDVIEWMEEDPNLTLIVDLNAALEANNDPDGNARRFLVLLGKRIEDGAIALIRTENADQITEIDQRLIDENVTNKEVMEKRLGFLMSYFGPDSPCYVCLENAKNALAASLTNEIDPDALVTQLTAMNAARNTVEKMDAALTEANDELQKVKKGEIVDRFQILKVLHDIADELSKLLTGNLIDDDDLKTRMQSLIDDLSGVTDFQSADEAQAFLDANMTEIAEVCQLCPQVLGDKLRDQKLAHDKGVTARKKQVDDAERVIQPAFTEFNTAATKQMQALEASLAAEKTKYEKGVEDRKVQVVEAGKAFDTAMDGAMKIVTARIQVIEGEARTAKSSFDRGVSQRESAVTNAKAVKIARDLEVDSVTKQPLEVVLLQQAGYKVEFRDGEIFMFGYPLSDLQDDEGRKSVVDELKAMKKALQAGRGDGFAAIGGSADKLAGVVDELQNNTGLVSLLNGADSEVTLPIATDSLAANIAQLNSHITSNSRPYNPNEADLRRSGLKDDETIQKKLAEYKAEAREFGRRMALLNDLKQKLEEANKAADALYVEVGKLFGHFDLAENLGLSANLPKNLISLRAMYAGLSRKGNFRLSDVEALSALYGELKGYLSDKAATTKLIMGINGAKMQIETIGNPDSVHESVRGAMVRLLHPDMHPAEQAKLAGESVKVDRALAALDPESQEWVDAMSADKLEAMTVPAFEKFYERMDLQKGGGTAKLKDVISNPARLVEPDSLRGLLKKSSIDYGIWAAIYLAFEEAAGGTLPLQCHIIREELEARVLKDPDSKPKKVKLSESKRVATAKDFVDALIDEQRVGAVTNFFHGYEDEVSEVRKRKIEIASIKQKLAVMQTDAEDFNKKQFLDTLKAANDDLELTDEEIAAIPNNRKASFLAYRRARIEQEAGNYAQAAGEVALKETAKLTARVPLWVANKVLGKIGLGVPEFITNFVAADVKGSWETGLNRAHKHHDRSVEKAALEKRLAELEEKHGKDPDRIPVSKTDINMKKFFTEAAGGGSEEEVAAAA